MVKLGIIGTGRIAGRFVQEARLVDGIRIEMIYNPDIQSAFRFAEQYGPCGYTDSIEELLHRVEAVYIASPHGKHYEYARRMLHHGKHVLCEKPMALQKGQAEELFHLSKEKNCILMEAIKTAYCPGFLAMMKMAESGVIGKVRDVEACFTRLTPTNVREMTDIVYGGSFTEFGSYVLLPILRLLGADYEEVCFQSLPGPNGLDVYTKAVFQYENGMGLGKTGLTVKSEGQLVISGTKGYILCESPWWMTGKFEIRYEDPAKREQYIYPYEGSGLRYEIEAFVQAISNGSAETRVTEAESIAIAGIMEHFLSGELRKKIKKRTESRERNAVKIWAHRGCSRKYPENTLGAFEAAAKQEGLTGIELDVQLTKDGVLVVIHDESVDRTTDGAGEVSKFTLQQLKKLKIETDNGESVSIPTLQEVLELLTPYCRQKGLLINIELKNNKIRYVGMEVKILQLVRQYHLEAYVVYSSFLPESVALIKELYAEAKTGVLCTTLEDCIEIADRVKADALHPHIGWVYGGLPNNMKNLPVRAWNTEEPFYGENRFFKGFDWNLFIVYGVTDVITNEPERYLAVLE